MNEQRHPEGAVSGFLLVDKPSGVTSFDVVAAVRRRVGVKQVGHGGTLDPLASGLLPILVGEATKLTPYLMGLDKKYDATVRLGIATDTYDAEGRAGVEADWSQITVEDVTAALPPFLGRVKQRPPAYSAIRKNGRRLYELARAGAEDMEIEEREVVIHALEVVRFTPPLVGLHVHCGKGTYVRSIAHDLGVRLGVGAHLAALRRTRIGHFDLADSVDVMGSTGKLALLPLEDAVAHLPSLAVDVEVERRLRMGQQAALEALDVPLDLVGALRLSDDKGRLVAMAEVARGGARLQLARVFSRYE